MAIARSATYCEGEARLVSRNGNDLTERFRDVVCRACGAEPQRSTGEVCALDEEGRPQSAMQQGTRGTPLVYEVFDVLELAGARPAARPTPAPPRRADRLQAAHGADRPAAARGGAGPGEARGRDGQAASSPYCEGILLAEAEDHGRQEFVICGWTRGEGRRAGGSALARARRVPRRRVAAGCRLVRGSRIASSTSCWRSSSRSGARPRRCASSRRWRRCARPT